MIDVVLVEVCGKAKNIKHAAHVEIVMRRIDLILKTTNNMNEILNKKISIKDYEHNNIKITVKIDYMQKTISIMENSTKGVKKWIFAERGLSYMQGWINILNAIENAIDEARTELQKYEDAQIEQNVKLMDKINKATK